MERKNKIKIDDLPPKKNVKGGLKPTSYFQEIPISGINRSRLRKDEKPQNIKSIKTLSLFSLSFSGALSFGILSSLHFEFLGISFAAILGGSLGLLIAAILWNSGETTRR